MSELSSMLEDAIGRADFLSATLAQEYRQISAEIALRISAKASTLLALNLIEIEIFPDAHSLTEFLAKGDSRARQIQLAGLVIVGMYQPQERRILLSAEPWQDDFTPEIRARNLGHELGHAVDGPDRTLSKSRQWQGIFQHEISVSRLEGRPLLDAGEAFAEVFSIMVVTEDLATSVETLGIGRALAFLSQRGLIDEA